MYSSVLHRVSRSRPHYVAAVLLNWSSAPRRSFVFPAWNNTSVLFWNVLWVVEVRTRSNTLKLSNTHYRYMFVNVHMGRVHALWILIGNGMKWKDFPCLFDEFGLKDFPCLFDEFGRRRSLSQALCKHLASPGSLVGSPPPGQSPGVSHALRRTVRFCNPWGPVCWKAN